MAIHKRHLVRKNRPREFDGPHCGERTNLLMTLRAHPRLFLFAPHDFLSLSRSKQKAAALAPWDPDSRRRQNHSSAFEWAAANKSHRASPTNSKRIFVYPHTAHATRQKASRDSHSRLKYYILFLIVCAAPLSAGRTP